jgi:hypothetical protein
VASLTAVFTLTACANAPHGIKNGRIIQENEIIRPVVYQPSEADEVRFDDYKPIAGRQNTAQGRQTPDAKAHGEYSATEKKTEKVILHGN